MSYNVNEFGFLPGPCTLCWFISQARNRREFYQENMELNAIQIWDKIPVECEISWSNTCWKGEHENSMDVFNLFYSK